MFLITLILIILSNIFFRFFSKLEKKLLNKIDFFFATLFLVLYFSGINETSDSENYRLIFENLKEIPDLGFEILSIIVKKIDGTYQLVIWFYYILSIFYIMKFINYYSESTFFIVANILIFTLFYHTNQIRYFLSFYIFLYSTILFNEKKYVKFVFNILLSLIFHKMIFILFVYFFLKKFSKDKMMKMTMCIGVFLASFYGAAELLVNKIPYFHHFKFYFIAEKKISLKGWLFNILFVWIWWFVIYLITKNINKKGKGIEEKYEDILKLIILPVTFIFIAFNTRDIFVRFITIFQIVNLTYITSIIKYFTVKKRIVILCFVLSLTCLNYFYYFELGKFIGVKTHEADLDHIYETYKLDNFIEKTFQE